MARSVSDHHNGAVAWLVVQRINRPLERNAGNLVRCAADSGRDGETQLVRFNRPDRANGP